MIQQATVDDPQGPPGTDAAACAPAGPQGPPTSLVKYPTNGVQREPLSGQVSKQILCPRVDHERRYWLNVWTGEKRPAWCDATMCPVCGPRQAWKKSLIISDGGTTGPPKRYFVLTQAPVDWEKLRQKMRNLPRYLARRGYSWDQAWTVEQNPAGTGLHVNVLQKGSYVPQAELQQAWGAIVHAQAIKSRRGGAKGTAAYSLKEAQKVAGYSIKNASTPANHLNHLAVNGGRLVHLSRGYLGGETQADVWERLKGPHVDAGWRLVAA